MLKFISLFLVIISSTNILFSGKIHKELINQINSANSINIIFTDTLSQSKGSLLLNKENKYKINFANRVIYSDSKSIYNHSPYDNQLIISSAEIHDLISLENIFLNLEKFTLLKESKVNSSINGVFYKLILENNDIKINLNLNSNNQIQSVLLNDSGDQYYWEINKITFSKDLRSNELDFIQPDSIEVIDLR